MTNEQASFIAAGSPRLAIHGAAAMNECIERLVLACRNTLTVRAGRLNFPFYASESFTECCQSILGRELRNELQFLVEDEQHLMRFNARLIALARQFSSYVKLRVIPEQYIEQPEMFIIRDGAAYLHQANTDYPNGVMELDAPGTARRFKRRFEDLWARSNPPAELFTLGL